MSRRLMWLSLACAILYFPGMPCAAANIRLALVTHSPDNDPWWRVVKNAMRDADEDFGVTTDYMNPPHGDVNDMKNILIKLANHSGYDGVISTIGTLGPIKSALQDISGKRIPLITINAGTDEQSAEVGAFMHIGQNDYQAGKDAGKIAKRAGVRNFLCVSHYGRIGAALARCSGFADALNVKVDTSILAIRNTSEAAQADMLSYLKSHPQPDAILTLGTMSAEPTLMALEKMGLIGHIYFATFDYSPVVLAAIRQGNIQFAIDQQAYLQGYLPIAILAIMIKQKTHASFKIRELLNANQKFQKRLETYDLHPSYNLNTIRSGPTFITRENIGKVEAFVGQYR